MQVTRNGCAGPVSASVSIAITGINDPVLQLAILIYPNPVHTVIFVASDALHPVSLRLTNVSGQLVIPPVAIGSSGVLPVGQLKIGCYFLQVTDRITGHSFVKMILKE